MTHGTTLIIGARNGSLGSALAAALAPEEMPVITAGISDEHLILDVNDSANVAKVLSSVEPANVVVTAGINVGVATGQDGYISALQRSMAVNFVGVMNVLHEWVRLRAGRWGGGEQFAVVSSNSAHIARTNSAAYCASKAALSMGVRVAARELKGTPLVYAYEFGLLRGTPMTHSTEQRFGPSQTRMPGFPEGLEVAEAARAMVNNLLDPWPGLNGSLLRFDAGEQ